MAFRPTHKHSNADALSQLPTETVEIEEPVTTELVNLMEAMDKMPITAETIKVWTQKDPLLARVYKYVQFGWPDYLWFRGCDSISRQTTNISRVTAGTPRSESNEEFGKNLFWWPGLTKNIEMLVKECAMCQENQSNPAVAPLEPWTRPTRPWARMHVDYGGPFMNSMVFIVTDAHSK